jgi:hypothetical protein
VHMCNQSRIIESKNMQTWARDSAWQAQGPEFKPQYYKINK